MKTANRKTRVLLLGAVVTALVAAGVFIASCGIEYVPPSTTQTPTALISPATLKAWMDAGLVNGTGYDRVLIVHVGNATYTTIGHIPGAIFVDSNLITQTRTDGVSPTLDEPLEGKLMDELIQQAGINGNTTIVFTGFSMLSAARAYFTFRYWGFPKNRLKLLDGLNGCTSGTTPPCVPVAGTWAQLYGPLSTDPAPVITPSTYSVRNIGKLGNQFRASLSEMIDYADGKVPNAVAIDVRTAATTTTGSYAGVRGSTAGNVNPPPTSPATDSLVFEGRIRGAKALLYSSHYVSNIFKPVDGTGGIVESFTNIGVDSTKTTYVYCRYGFMGAVTFFVLDGILGWPAVFYDGSWTQWGQLSGNGSMHGQLAANSPWRTDIPSRSELIVYNNDLVSGPAFYGTGRNDLTTGGDPGASSYRFKVEIDGIAPDTFRWSSDGGTTWTGSLVSIDGLAQTLGTTGITVTFAATTGHALNDYWYFTAGQRKAIEQLTADGTVCSATYNTDGTIVNSSGGNTACENPPISDDNSGNRIEAEDIIYMRSGTGGGGTGGGTGGGC